SGEWVNLLKFETNRLSVAPKTKEYASRVVGLSKASDPAVLHQFVNNITHASLGLGSLPVTNEHLCAVREMMLKRHCTMESLSLVVENDVAEDFVWECFGVKLENDFSSDFKIRTYKCSNTDLQLYSSNPLHILDLTNFE
ncbi:hypothetical protein PFISCL1PPCAC_19182, partial [Pristionchus fissidentatus]